MCRSVHVREVDSSVVMSLFSFSSFPRTSYYIEFSRVVNSDFYPWKRTQHRHFVVEAGCLDLDNVSASDWCTVVGDLANRMCDWYFGSSFTVNRVDQDGDAFRLCAGEFHLNGIGLRSGDYWNGFWDVVEAVSANKAEIAASFPF